MKVKLTIPAEEVKALIVAALAAKAVNIDPGDLKVEWSGSYDEQDFAGYGVEVLLDDFVRMGA
jgi:hypothetical protein